MDNIKVFLGKTINQPIDVWFFFLFLLTFTLSVRKVLFYFPLEGTFNEYTGIYVYISDIFLALALISWCILILCNIKSYLSMFNLWITPRINRLSSRLALELKFLFPGYASSALSKKILSLSHLSNKMFHLPTEQAGVEHPSQNQKDIPSDTKLISNLPLANFNDHYIMSDSHVPRVEHETSRETPKFYVPRLIPVLLLIWAFLSIAWSDNRTIALFRSIKVAEFYLLYLFVATRIVPPRKDLECSTWNILNPRGKRGIEESNARCSTPALWNVPRGTYSTGWNNSVLILIAIATIQSIIAIIQILFQHSIGLHWLGESLIISHIPGVAKLMFHGNIYIRAYGLFPHPNILGGFLLFSIILSLWQYRLFHVEQSGGDKNIKLLQISIAIQALALIFTGSKSAIIGLFIGILYVLYSSMKITKLFHARPVECSTPAPRNVPRGTYFTGWNIFNGVEQLRHKGLSKLNVPKNFNVHISKSKILLGLIILMIGYVAKPNLQLLLLQPLQERQFYVNVSRGTIMNNLVIGAGMGQFVWNMPQYVIGSIENWQFQPVHNVFLLIWSELGMIGLGLFMWFLWKLFQKPKAKIGECCILSNNSDDLSRGIFLKYTKAILIGFLFIMLFDHYLWDIQQGSLMLWMTMGLIAGQNRK